VDGVEKSLLDSSVVKMRGSSKFGGDSGRRSCDIAEYWPVDG
jgi:hypothetical protein